MASPKFLLPKYTDQETNCGNAIAENGRKKKIVVAEITCEELKKKSATSIIFLQQITGD